MQYTSPPSSLVLLSGRALILCVLDPSVVASLSSIYMTTTVNTAGATRPAAASATATASGSGTAKASGGERNWNGGALGGMFIGLTVLFGMVGGILV